METSPVLAFKVFVSAAVVAGLIDMYVLLVIKFFEEKDSDWVKDSSEESFTGRRLMWRSRPKLFSTLIGNQTIEFMKSRTMLFPLFELTFSAVVLASLYIHGVNGNFARSVLYTLIAVPIALICWDRGFVYTIMAAIGVAVGVVTSLLPGSTNIIDSLLGILLSGLVAVVCFVLARIMFPIQKSPFGLGAVYVSMMIGAFTGLSRLQPSLFVGIVLAAVYFVDFVGAKRIIGGFASKHIAYSPFLLVGGIYGMLIGRP